MPTESHCHCWQGALPLSPALAVVDRLRPHRRPLLSIDVPSFADEPVLTSPEPVLTSPEPVLTSPEPVLTSPRGLRACLRAGHGDNGCGQVVRAHVGSRRAGQQPAVIPVMITMCEVAPPVPLGDFLRPLTQQAGRGCGLLCGPVGGVRVLGRRFAVQAGAASSWCARTSSGCRGRSSYLHTQAHHSLGLTQHHHGFSMDQSSGQG